MKRALFCEIVKGMEIAGQSVVMVKQRNGDNNTKTGFYEIRVNGHYWGMHPDFECASNLFDDAVKTHFKQAGAV